MGQLFSVTSRELEAESAFSLDLRRQANSALPIFRLPEELLVLIFHECRKEDFIRSRNLWRGRWISCTHVCHDWRIVALTNPQLWNHVVITPGAHEEKLEAWLARSGTASLSTAINIFRAGDSDPLFYTYSYTDSFSASTLNRIAQELPRTTNLYMSVDRNTLTLLQLPNSLSSLKGLYFMVEVLSAHDEQDVLIGNIRARFPALKRYRTYGGLFRSDHWILPHTLTELKVNNTEARITYTLHDILEALNQTPLLESLVLENAVPSIVTHTDVPRRNVHLPFLQHLHLSGLLDTQIVMLNAIQPRSSTRLRLDLSMRNDFGHIASLPRSFLSTYLGDVKSPQGVAISIEYCDPVFRAVDWNTGSCRLSFTAWSNPQTFTSMKRPAGPANRLPGVVCASDSDIVDGMLFSISFRVTDFTIDVSRQSIRGSVLPLERLLSTFPLSDVRTLALACTTGPIFGAPSVYQKMAKLHTLCICDARSYARGLEDVLQRLDLAGVVGDGTIVFPDLRILALSNIECHRAQEHFLEMLEKRRLWSTSGAPLLDDGQLLLHDCYSLTRSYVEKLGHVAAVEWDGLERRTYQ